MVYNLIFNSNYMNLKTKNLHFRRAFIFQDIAMVERIMNRLICLNYFKTVTNKEFTSELLQDQYFSFELRKRIFKLIYEKMYPKLKFPWKALQEMQRLRNIIAHSLIDEEILVNNRTGKRVKLLKKPFYSYHTEEREVVSLHKEFQTHMDKVVKALNGIKADTNQIFKKLPIIKL